nr:MAG TPA: hypothetical protein [Caudoviricetes sp.]
MLISFRFFMVSYPFSCSLILWLIFYKYYTTFGY